MPNTIKASGLKNVSENTHCRHSDNFQYSLSKLTLSAKRALFLILAQIDNPKVKPKDDSLTFTITASDFAKLCNLSTANNSYVALERGVSDLSKSFIYNDVSVGGLGRLENINITQKVTYHYTEACCSVKINSDVYPYFFELSRSFTKNNLLEALRIPEKVLFNFYQVINKRYSKSEYHPKYKTGFVIEIEELKDEMWLFTTNEKGKEKKYRYPVYADFSKLLSSLAKGLMEYTSFKRVAFEIAEKKGRKATHLRVIYAHKYDIEKAEEKEVSEKRETEENEDFERLMRETENI